VFFPSHVPFEPRRPAPARGSFLVHAFVPEESQDFVSKSRFGGAHLVSDPSLSLQLTEAKVSYLFNTNWLHNCLSYRRKAV
jgi:hypothetical protein